MFIMRIRYYLLAGMLLGSLGALWFLSRGNRSVGCIAEFREKNDVIYVNCQIVGKEAALSEIAIYDEDSELKLWEIRTHSDISSTFDFTLGKLDDSSEVGQDRVVFVGPPLYENQKFRIIFRGCYVPWWPPAVSGWITIYFIHRRDGKLIVEPPKYD